MKIVEPNQHLSLDNYAAHAHLRASVVALQADAERHVRPLRDRTIWMLNSTAQGGGVAELLPAQISLLRQLGLDVRWAVLETENADFFKFTKRLHNLVHAAPEALPTDDDRKLYEAVNQTEAEAFVRLVKPADLLVVHDPQPLALGALVKKQLGLRCIWRCHIGVDEETPGTRAAWTFMRPYAEQYDATVFSVADYIPAYLRDRSVVIHPSIDPLSHKNRDLSLHKLVGILSCSDLAEAHWPLMCPPFPHRARRLQADGSLRAATTPEDFGLLARPIITQVSRWDRLKGFAPLLDAFVQLKIGNHAALRDERHGRRLQIARLVLAGADPDSIPDDPEAHAIFAELRAKYCALSPEVQQDIAIIALPIESRKNNALMVNALQRAADIIVQNSLREGFGLTVAEGMWKRLAVLGSAAACGVRLQVRDGVDGRLINNPENVSELTEAMVEMLADQKRLEEYGRNAQYRVHDQFLIFSELRQWLGLFNGATFGQ